MAKEASQEAQQEQISLKEREATYVELSNGKKVRVGWTWQFALDKFDAIMTDYEKQKQAGKADNETTRKMYAKCVSALLSRTYFGMKLFWWLRWRWNYYFGKWSGSDYLNVIVEAKKKLQEQEYYTAMEFMMAMTTTWTIMTKREAEEYHRGLELVRKAQSLKNSQD